VVPRKTARKDAAADVFGDQRVREYGGVEDALRHRRSSAKSETMRGMVEPGKSSVASADSTAGLGPLVATDCATEDDSLIGPAGVPVIVNLPLSRRLGGKEFVPSTLLFTSVDGAQVPSAVRAQPTYLRPVCPAALLGGH